MRGGPRALWQTCEEHLVPCDSHVRRTSCPVTDMWERLVPCDRHVRSTSCPVTGMWGAPRALWQTCEEPLVPCDRHVRTTSCPVTDMWGGPRALWQTCEEDLMPCDRHVRRTLCPVTDVRRTLCPVTGMWGGPRALWQTHCHIHKTCMFSKTAVTVLHLVWLHLVCILLSLHYGTPSSEHNCVIFSVVKPARYTSFSNLFILEQQSTCFVRSFRPSSGVQDCTYTNRYMLNRYCWLLASGNEMEHCSFLFPLARPSKTCRVLFQNK
jgi:hypothetical protein